MQIVKLRFTNSILCTFCPVPPVQYVLLIHCWKTAQMNFNLAHDQVEDYVTTEVTWIFRETVGVVLTVLIFGVFQFYTLHFLPCTTGTKCIFDVLNIPRCDVLNTCFVHVLYGYFCYDTWTTSFHIFYYIKL